MDEMDQIEDGLYTCTVILGDTCIEEFQLVANENPNETIYPISGKSNMASRIMGPDWKGEGKYWLIDGRADNALADTAYRITFEWKENMRIRWEMLPETPEDAIQNTGSMHQYLISGSFTRWGLQEMTAVREVEGFYEVRFPIGETGREEFHFVRDRDLTQVIYPAVTKPDNESIPVRGPDDMGDGKNWLVHGHYKEIVTARIFVVNGDITVQVLPSSKEGTKVWTSVVDKDVRYYISNLFNAWQCHPMMPDEQTSGVYTYKLMLEAWMDEFQIVVDADRKHRLHPTDPQARCGESITAGPDNQGDELNWQIEGSIGDLVVITLDLNQRDKRKIVSWTITASTASLKKTNPD